MWTVATMIQIVMSKLFRFRKKEKAIAKKELDWSLDQDNFEKDESDSIIWF